MEILVLMMLALFLGIIVISVVMYVVFRNNIVSKSFDKKIANDIDYPLDDDDDDFLLPNITLPINLNNLMEKDNKVESSGEIIETENNIIDDKEFTEDLKKETIEEKVDNLDNGNILNNDKGKFVEVVNILIDKKNYTFLANNNKVSKNEHLKLIINNKIYFGTVTKANYIRDISLLKIKPKKLIIVKNKVKKEKQNIDNEMEFVPIKKKKD